jgi:hypothetical protein
MQDSDKSIRLVIEKSVQALSSETLDFLKRELDAFVFFHLGSDADVSVSINHSRIHFSLDHNRIHSFSFSLSFEEFESITDQPEAFENVLLGYLAKHRKS